MQASQIRAARAMLEWSQSELSVKTGVAPGVIEKMEASDAGLRQCSKDAVAAVTSVMESAGIQFIPENGGGAGVRLKFSRREVKAIDGLENEGGIVGEDDF